MCFHLCRTRKEPETNLIPLIDALLVALIFLMVMTAYFRYTELKVNPPTAETERAIERPDQIVVSATASDVYSVDKQMLGTHDVTNPADALRNAAGKVGGPEPIVIVNADVQVTHQAVVNVMEATRVAGPSRLIFVTQADNAR